MKLSKVNSLSLGLLANHSIAVLEPDAMSFTQTFGKKRFSGPEFPWLGHLCSSQKASRRIDKESNKALRISPQDWLCISHKREKVQDLKIPFKKSLLTFSSHLLIFKCLLMTFRVNQDVYKNILSCVIHNAQMRKEHAYKQEWNILIFYRRKHYIPMKTMSAMYSLDKHIEESEKYDSRWN